MCRSAIGLRASSPSRSVADTMPHTPPASVTARCSAPAATMSTAASTASCATGTVGTGVRAISLTGASRATSPPVTEARTSASVRIPSRSSPSRTSSAEVAFCPRRPAAWRNGSSGSQNVAARMIAETGVVPTSRSAWTVWPAPVSRLRIDAAT